MKKVVTAGQMHGLDEYTISYHKVDSLVLMERAALSVVKHLKEYDLTYTLIVCGSGNNGGDGIAIARLLHLMGVQVSVYFAGNPEHKSEGCTRQMEVAKSYGVRWINNPDYSEYTTIVDALLGVGLSRTITGNCADIITGMNQAGVPIIAVDIPSGVNADDGKIMGCAVNADRTVTFAFAKVGQLIQPGKKYCGQLFVEDIGIYDNASECDKYYSIEEKDMNLIPLRKTEGNKGTFGKVLLIAGSPQMPGASILCGRTIMRMGAGMLRMVVPYENREMIASTMPETMLALYHDEKEAVEQIKNSLTWADVIVIGPGLGTDVCAETMVSYVLSHSQLPLVLDADALNIVSVHPEWLESCDCPCILTPHVGEMARLLKTNTKDVAENLLCSLHTFIKKYKVQCILKDSATCIGMPDGKTYINTTGNCGMATAGSGDVLTGIIGGLLSIGTNWEYVGALGVWIHGTAGDRYMKKYGTAHLMASDLIDELADLRIGEKGGKSDEKI